MSSVVLLADVTSMDGVRRSLEAACSVFDRSFRSHDELAGVGYRAPDGTAIWALEDHVGEVAYLTIDGPTEVAWAERIGRLAPCVGLVAALAELGAAADPRRWIRTMSRLAVLRDGDGAAQHEAALVRAWSAALAHPERPVRRAAIRTAYGARWPALVAIVEARIVRDSELRGPLQQLLAHLVRLRDGV